MLECSVQKLDYCIQGQGHSDGSKCQWLFVQMISSEPQNIITKLGMVMQHHESECHAEKIAHCLQCQGHTEGLYNQNIIISSVSSKPLVHLQTNLV